MTTGGDQPSTEAGTPSDQPQPQQQQHEALATLEAAAQQHGVQLDTLANKAIASGDLAALDLSHLGDEAATEFRGHAEAALAVYQKQADDFVASLGVEPSHFYAWAQQHNPVALQDAMRQQYFAKDPKAYEPLARAYLQRVAPDVATMKAAGLQATTTRDGRQLVTIAGMTMTAAAAARAGLI